MAKQNEDKPLAELTAEARKNVEEMGAELERAEKDVAALDELGLETSRLKERIAWAKHAREVILKRMT